MQNQVSPSQDYRIIAVSYPVASSKGDGTVYSVRCDPRDGSVIDCDCPHRRHGRKSFCRHMKLAASKDHGGIRPRIRIALHCREVAPAPVDSRRELAALLYA